MKYQDLFEIVRSNPWPLEMMNDTKDPVAISRDRSTGGHGGKKSSTLDIFV